MVIFVGFVGFVFKKKNTKRGNHFETEAIPNTLPKNQNSPQVIERFCVANQPSWVFSTGKFLSFFLVMLMFLKDSSVWTLHGTT
jgi:hypothetical protein